MATADQKLKRVYLARILEQETDDEHGLTGPQIIGRLAYTPVSRCKKIVPTNGERSHFAAFWPALRVSGNDFCKRNEKSKPGFDFSSLPVPTKGHANRPSALTIRPSVMARRARRTATGRQ